MYILHWWFSWSPDHGVVTKSQSDIISFEIHQSLAVQCPLLNIPSLLHYLICQPCYVHYKTLVVIKYKISPKLALSW